MMVERHVFHADLGKAGGERLLRWCRGLGADAFTFTVIGSLPELEHQAAAIEAPFQPFQILPSVIQTVPEGQPGSYWTRPSVLWKLNETSESLLLNCFPRGILTYVPAGGSWCEDPCFFRDGELMLGVISHEDEGVLRIRPSEQLALDQSELPYRLKGEWVGY